MGILRGRSGVRKALQRAHAQTDPPDEGRPPDNWTASLHEFTRRTLQMDLLREPGQPLANLIHEVFAFEAVAIYDADLGAVYQAGAWHDDPLELAQNV